MIYMKIKLKILLFSICVYSFLSAESKVLASDGAEDDRYGKNVALFDEWFAVSANRDDDNGLNSGSVYIYNKITLDEYKITPSDGSSDDFFGKSISIYGNWLAVGSVYDDENGLKSGSAYIFHYDGTNWIEYTKIVPIDGAPSDRFGYSIDIYDDVLICGAVYDDDGGEDSGAVYIYKLINGIWVYHQKILSSDSSPGDFFGVSLAIDSDIIAVGSVYDDDMGENSGSVSIFQIENYYWEETQKIVPDDGEDFDFFANSLDLNTGKLVVSAFYDDSENINSGSVYIYDMLNSDFEFSYKIEAEDSSLNDTFGLDVSIYDNWLAIGSLNNDNGLNSGSVYLYELGQNYILRQTKISPEDGNAYDEFSISLALGENELIVGAHFDDDLGDDSGSVYIYQYLGCEHDLACNYSNDVIFNDNEVCEFPSNGYDCNNECYENIDECGVCAGSGSNGDVNYDSEVNISDIIILIEDILGIGLYELNFCTSDISLDNIINVTDVVMLIEYVLYN